MSIRTKLASWFVPSNWVEWLKTKKRLVGGVSLLVWVLLYAIPVLNPAWTTAAEIGRQLAALFNYLGIPLDATLLEGGAGLTVIGWVDWLLDYAPTNLTKKALLTAEKPFRNETPNPPKADSKPA
jgi:hypothetical protein